MAVDFLIGCTCGSSCFIELSAATNPLINSTRDVFYIRMFGTEPRWIDDLGVDSGIVCEQAIGGMPCAIAVMVNGKIDRLNVGPHGHFLSINNVGPVWTTAVGQNIQQEKGHLLLTPNIPMACPQWLENPQIMPGRVTLDRSSGNTPIITYP